MQGSLSYQLLKSNEVERPGSKAANHEISQSHSNYFNDSEDQKESANPYLDNKLKAYLESNL